MTKENRCKKYTTIGGSALIEGIMMRGEGKMAIAVRKSDGRIILKAEKTAPQNKLLGKLPVIRGVIAFVSSIILSYKCLAYSAELSAEDIAQEPAESKADKALGKFLENGGMMVLSVFSIIIAVVISLGAFVWLPSFLTGLLGMTGVLRAVGEGFIKILIFFSYMLIVSRLPDIKRVFEYHGAEHKTIFCFEAKKPLTCESAAGFSRFHPRCGTSFLLLTLIISIFISMFITSEVVWMRFVIKSLCIPAIMGISYEFIRICGRYDNIATRIISAPGMWFQRITTAEPDHSQLEIAICALRGVLDDVPLDKRLIVTESGEYLPDDGGGRSACNENDT